MTRLEVLIDAAHAAVQEAMDAGEAGRAIRLSRIVAAIHREMDNMAHHPNCECNRCYSNMGDVE